MYFYLKKQIKFYICKSLSQIQFQGLFQPAFYFCTIVYFFICYGGSISVFEINVQLRTFVMGGSKLYVIATVVVTCSALLMLINLKGEGVSSVVVSGLSWMEAMERRYQRLNTRVARHCEVFEASKEVVDVRTFGRRESQKFWATFKTFNLFDVDRGLHVCLIPKVATAILNSDLFSINESRGPKEFEIPKDILKNVANNVTRISDISKPFFSFTVVRHPFER